MKYIVYITRNNVNGKIYVGVHQTENPNVFDGYFGCGVSLKDSHKLLHPKTPFHYALKKYGFKNFSRTTIQVFDTMDEALKLEAEIVDEKFVKRTDTYNVCLGGGMPPNLSKTVFQYDLQGNLLNSFSSLEEASRKTNLAPNTICSAIYNKSLTRSYYWSYNKVDQLDVASYSKRPRNIKELYLYDCNGQYIRSINTINDFCKIYSISMSHVKKAIEHGTRCKGYFLSLSRVPQLTISYNVRGSGKVFQYDLLGNLVAEYNNTKEIHRRTGFKESGINAAARQYKPYKGYLWSRGEHPIQVKSCENLPSKKKKVGRYSLTGELLEELNSVKEARLKYGSSVVHVLKGTQNQTRGFVFRYL